MVLWDHGNGWYDNKAILFDNNPNDFISITKGELRNIAEDAAEGAGRKVDIILFDACDMQTIEVLYEIRNYAEISLGTEIRCPYYGMPYNKVLPLLKRSVSDFELSKEICDTFFADYKEEVDSLQISAVQLKYIDKIVNSFINENILAFPRINEFDVSIPSAYFEDAVYSLQDKEYMTGIKIFAPEDYHAFLSLYESYTELAIDSAKDILRREFRSYGVADEVPPLRTYGLEIRELSNSNILFNFNASYDFSEISFYNLHIFTDINIETETFNDTFTDIQGDYTFSENIILSEPFSIRCTDIYFTIPESTFYSIHIFAQDTVFVVLGNDSLEVASMDEWTVLALPLGISGEVRMKSDKGFYIDDINIIKYNESMNQTAYNDEYLLHKLKSGNHCVFVTAQDILGNGNYADTLYLFSIDTPLTLYAYPNPANSSVYLKNEFEGRCRFILNDAGGRKIDEFITVNPENYMIDLNPYNLAPGIYFVVVITETGTYRCKFVYYD